MIKNSRVPLFPTSGFVGYTIIATGSHLSFLYPLNEIFTDINDFQISCQNIYKNIKNKGFLLSETGLLLPINLKELYPLKPEFWQKPNISYTIQQRNDLLTKAIKYYDLYKILITPSAPNNEQESFNIASAFLYQSCYDFISQFMRFSDYPVDISAKFSAIYNCEKPLDINWINGSIGSTSLRQIAFKYDYN